MKRSLHRRELLKALGLSVALGPFVPYLDRQAEAAAGAFPKRLVLAYAPNGTIEERFWPTGSESNFSFPSGCITESLAPHSSSLIFLRNAARQKPRGGGPHEVAMGSLWTGCSLNPDPSGSGRGYGLAAGPSVDQILADKLPQTTPFKSLALSVMHGEEVGSNLDATTRYMTYLGSDRPVIPDSDPYHVFSSLMLSEGAAGISAVQLAQAQAEKKSVIDLVLAELGTLASKVGQADREKIDSHVNGLREIELRLEQLDADNGSSSGCLSSRPATGYEKKLLDNDSFPALLRMQTDLLVAALACERAQIASLQWSRTFSMLRHNWLGAHAPEHHTNSHETTADALDWQYRISRWYCEQLAELLTKLKAVKEGDGTLLDHSLVVWGYDMNVGATHAIDPAIAVLAGNLGGTLKTGQRGRLLDVARRYDWTQLLLSICHAMDVPDVQSVGNLGQPGIISELFG